MPTLRSNRNAMGSLCAFVFLCGLASACDRPEHGTGRVLEPRCQSDGLCWQQVGKRSIEGGFRKNGQELKFDILFSPLRAFDTQYKDEWSFRLLDWEGNSFFSAYSSNPPLSWRVRDKDEGVRRRAMKVQSSTIRERLELKRELHVAASQETIGPKHLRKPWSQFVRLIDDGWDLTSGSKDREEVAVPTNVIDGSHEAYIVDIRDGTIPSAMPFEEYQRLEWNERAVSQQADQEEGEEALAEEILDGSSQSEDTAIRGDDGQSFLHQDGEEAMTVLRGKGGGRLEPARFEVDEAMEYSQNLDLYSKHARSFLVGGWKTKKHHSAACISVVRRPRDSEGPWEPYDKVCTSNHGQQANSGEMKLYAICRGMPITKGYVAYAGECGGRFPTHFCNDDTALQIRHAHGIYDDGRKCLGRKRVRRPWCEVPW